MDYYHPLRNCPTSIPMNHLDSLGIDDEEIIDDEIEQAILDEGFLMDSFLVCSSYLSFSSINSTVFLFPA